MTPEQLAEAGSEHAHQRALFAWAAMAARHGFTAANDSACYTTKNYAVQSYGTHNAVPTLSDMFAIPNGGERHAAVAAKLKAEGVKPGVSDIMLPVPRSGYKGKATALQLDFLNRMRNNGFAGVVAQHWLEAASVIQLYYQNEHTTLPCDILG